MTIKSLVILDPVSLFLLFLKTFAQRVLSVSLYLDHMLLKESKRPTATRARTKQGVKRVGNCKAGKQCSNSRVYVGAYSITRPEQQTTDGCEQDTDENKGGQDGLGCQNRLPCLQPLLFEIRV